MYVCTYANQIVGKKSIFLALKDAITNEDLELCKMNIRSISNYSKLYISTYMLVGLL